MSYAISYIEEKNIVCVTGCGRITAEEYRKGSREAVDLLEKHGSTRLLADDRLVDNAASVFDLYGLPRFFGSTQICGVKSGTAALHENL